MIKRTGKTKSKIYKGVYISNINGKDRIMMHFPGHNGKAFATERDAAIAYDMLLIKNGKSPINVLKKHK